MKEYLSSIDEIIMEAKSGKMFILVDDENRENEGDLVIPAQFCNDRAVNFMAKEGRGLICLALAEKRVKELNLPLMSLNNQSRNKTAFTVSIEAKDGITTGISAFDRAKTIADAIDNNKGGDSIVSPGHIFPLKAQNGGVLVRAGHTEAAVDIARLAGLNPSGVICEIMNDDGQMARMPDLIEFAKKHGLKIATIADLIEYRRKNEKLVEVVHEQKFASKEAGEFDLKIYKSHVDGVEHIALVKGKVRGESPTLVRMHHLNIFSDCLSGFGERSSILQDSMRIINENESGVVVIIRQPNESVSDYLGIKKQDNDRILRNYGTGAQILLDIGVKKINLISSSQKSVVGLEGYGLEIVDYTKI